MDGRTDGGGGGGGDGGGRFLGASRESTPAASRPPPSHHHSLAFPLVPRPLLSLTFGRGPAPLALALGRKEGRKWGRVMLWDGEGEEGRGEGGRSSWVGLAESQPFYFDPMRGSAESRRLRQTIIGGILPIWEAGRRVTQ